MEPYYRDDRVTIYHGDCREVLSGLGERFDTCIADPPYAETSLDWDRWPEGWVAALPSGLQTLWCFGSLSLFMRRCADFAGWTFSQDVIWEKHNGSNMANDRFRRVHEHVVLFYRGEWSQVFKSPQFTQDATKKTARRKTRPTHWGSIDNTPFESQDGGPRMMRSVLQVRSCHGYAVHPTQKPLGILSPLIRYSSPADGNVLDPMCGSGSTLVIAKALGRRATGIEGNEYFCEVAARRCETELVEASA